MTAATRELSLLLPEWQGCGTDASVAGGARALAARLGASAFLEVAAPESETLPTVDGVVGLDSIAARSRASLEAIEARQPARLFTIGGTCGTELAPVSYLNARYRGDLCVVWLDAHADLNTPASSPSAHFHGMVLRTLLGDGPAALVDRLPRRLSREQVILAGTRDVDRDEAVFISDAPIAWLRPADLLVPDRVAGRVRARGFTKVYVHLDVDVFDPVEFPDSLMRTPAGVSMSAVAETIRALQVAFDVVGFSVVEFRPRSTDAAARLVNWLDRLRQPV